MIIRSGGMYAARAVSCRAQWVRSARKTVQWTVFSGERAVAPGHRGSSPLCSTQNPREK